MMRDELTCWDAVKSRGFTGLEAALAIVGNPKTNDAESLENASPVLELMQRCYEGTRRWFANAPEDGDTAPMGMLVSVEMQAAQCRTNAELANVGAGDWRFQTWLRATCADFDRQTFTRDVLARWVKEVGVSSLYPFERAVPLVVPVVAEPEPIRRDLLATRGDLFAAFEVWGLKMGMFTNLTERQWLMDARKVKGQGQRGSRIEPLFCPLQVMQGLATKTKKPKLSESKGWDILEHKFKAVFEEYQQFDPREQTG